MSDEITSAVVEPWATELDIIWGYARASNTILSGMKDRLLATQSEVENIHTQLCQDVEQCIAPAVTDFYKKGNVLFKLVGISDKEKAWETLALGGEIVKATDGAVAPVAAIERMDSLTEDTMRVALIRDAQSLIALVISGQLTQIAQIAQILKLGMELHLIRQLKDNLQSGATFISNLSEQVANLDGILRSALEPNWQNDPAISNASFSIARDSISRVQALLRNEAEPIRKLMSHVNGALEALRNLPFSGRELIMDFKVASYQRWSEASFNVLCSHTATQHYEAAGFKASFDYPAFEVCPYGPKTLPWPNHHIPYLKFRFST